MSESKINTAIGFSVIHVTKHIMNSFSLNYEDAYRKLMETDFYEMLNDFETGLYLEENEYLDNCFDIEINNGKNAFYDYIIAEYQ